MRPLGFFAILVGSLVLLQSGCGSAGKAKPVAADGILTWEDGKPISEATVVFLPEDPNGRQADGLTGKDGSFALTTFNQDDGAIPGDYKVVITKKSTDTEMPQKGEDLAKAMKDWSLKHKKSEKIIPDVYTQPKTTPLKWRVESGGGKIKLKLKTA